MECEEFKKVTAGDARGDARDWDETRERTRLENSARAEESIGPAGNGLHHKSKARGTFYPQNDDAIVACQIRVSTIAEEAVAMPQTEEAQWWFDAVYRAVQTVPIGTCTTYGHIALLLGHPQRARQVGVCLKHLPNYDDQNPDMHFFHGDNVPWQRVVNAKGGISPRGDGGLAVNRQVERLRAEGVEVSDARGVEENFVDLSKCGWFPKRLPGEESESDEEEAKRH